MDCPNCRAAMLPRTLDGHGGRATAVTVDSCSPCTLFWFDTLESVRLTPRAVLDLFRYIGEAGGAHNALRSDPACPRCRKQLAFTHDVARTTRFTYWRCAQGHGKLATFHQFLAEKQFVRPPSADELARLRSTVRQVSCSQCGAPVDLRRDSACAHCGAPVTLIDPAGVQKALCELSEGRAAGARADADAVGRQLSDAQIEALFALERERTRSAHDERRDLISVGAAAIGALIGGWLSA
jgi:hypothetical protein